MRLFNPFTFRRLKRLQYLVGIPRLNHRMHNKSLTADDQVTISGGRNIGDEYFGATEGPLFADLDILAVGPVLRTMAEDFDRYWASDSAYPAATLLPPPPAGAPVKAPEAGPTPRHWRARGRYRGCWPARPSWNGRPCGWSATTRRRAWARRSRTGSSPGSSWR